MLLGKNGVFFRDPPIEPKRTQQSRPFTTQLDIIDIPSSRQSTSAMPSLPRYYKALLI